MTREERNALFQSVLDDVPNMSVSGPKMPFDELIDDFIRVYGKAGKLIKKYCKYYVFSKSLEKSDIKIDECDKCIERLMKRMEEPIEYISNFINNRCAGIFDEIAEKNETHIKITWNKTSDDDGDQRKQRFISTLQTIKEEINQMKNIMGSIKTLSRTRDQLTEILQTNGLLSEEEVNSLQ